MCVCLCVCVDRLQNDSTISSSCQRDSPASPMIINHTLTAAEAGHPADTTEAESYCILRM